MWATILEWATAITAVLALIRPELTKLYNRWFQRPMVDVFEAGTIELGFSQWGPIMNLSGTLRAVHADAFITRMSLKISRKDGLTASFDWTIFRSLEMSSNPSFVPCSSFLLRQEDAWLYNVAFTDRDTQERLLEITQALKKRWDEKCKERVGEFSDLTAASLAERITAVQLELRPEFRADKFYVQSYTKIGDLIYWKAGSYELELRVSTSRPDKQHSQRWRFELTEEQAELLRLNQGIVLDMVIGGEVGAPNFIHTKYK